MVKITRVWKKLLGLKAPPPEFVGYENLIAFIRHRDLLRLEGDLIEIGAYMGGGTVKLAKLANQFGKRLYVIDTFDPTLDKTVSKSGITATEVYQAFLEGRSMWEVYRDATRPFRNIITTIDDSRNVSFDDARKFVFGFVDGCHEKTHVENDFYLVWRHLVPGGVVGFHDYRYDDWPGVTEALTHLMDKHKYEIGETHEIVGSYGITSILLTRK